MFTLAGDNGGARTRNSAGVKGLKTQYSRTDVRKHSFAVRTVEMWNKIPNDVRKESKQETFKRKLKTVL